MKKIVLLLAVCCPLIMYGQNFQVGVKGGVNVSNFTGGDIDTKSLVGFHIGGLLSFGLGDYFSLQPEVLFSSQGARYDMAGQKENLVLSYINVPVMVKFRTEGGFYVEAGPQVGFKVGEDANVPGQTIENFAKDLDLSVGAGIGYHGSSGIGIGARYMAGLSKVGDFDAATADPDFKNSVIQVSLFYTLFNNR